MGGHGELQKLYYKGLKSFAFFERPYGFDIYYLLNLAYTYADLICVLFIYDGQTDFFVMLFHHLCTICCIYCSLYFQYASVGSLILFLHNASDIVVYLSRTMLYIKIPAIFLKIQGPVLLFTFIYFRQYVLGKIIYGIIFDITWETYGLNNIFSVFIICLYILHLDWSFKLIKLAYKAIFKNTYSDSREFTEDKKINQKIK